MVFCMIRIPPEQKKWFPEVFCIFLNTAGAKTRQFALRKIPLSAAIRIPPEQLSPEYTSSNGK
jgi:hypothetical protein